MDPRQPPIPSEPDDDPARRTVTAAARPFADARSAAVTRSWTVDRADSSVRNVDLRFQIDDGGPGRPLERFEDVAAALLGLTGDGPCFAIVERGPSYVQAAGDAKRLTVEWRSANASGFKHWVIGRAENAGGFTEITCRVGPIVIQQNEALTAADAVEIFRAFHDRAPMPSRFRVRDVTSMFLSDATS